MTSLGVSSDYEARLALKEFFAAVLEKDGKEELLRVAGAFLEASGKLRKSIGPAVGVVEYGPFSGGGLGLKAKKAEAGE